jgi:subtilisin-like proprotein convertase family protein
MSLRVCSLTRHLLLFWIFIGVYTESAHATITYENIITGASNSEDAAWSYVLSHTKLLQSTNGAALDLAVKKHSLLGTHYYFQQSRNGIPIEDAEVVVSVRDSDLVIFRVFNSALPTFQKLSIEDDVKITQDKAYDIAWKDLGVTGPLMDSPSIKLVYVASKGHLKLVYKVKLAVSAPFGYWQYTIAANSGKILSKEDTRLIRIEKTPTPKVLSRGGPLLERTTEFGAYYGRLFKQVLETPAEENSARGDGTGLLFDPNPRTTLMDNTLQNNSAPERFNSAYMTRILKDLTLSNGKYTLVGPWVQIKDFEPPHTAPSTTADGKWNFKRGNNGFNDAMTYFHIDQNQRYIQSLGFVGDKGIQNRSIEVDSDGVDGDDNSHFIPSQNRIAFGHGCVPDNEDSDVILHEYGHAIQDSISRNWHGGDTGAMGEGFGDYWASSYHMSTPNGTSFFPDRVFHWDANGEGSRCWPGRSVDVQNAKYDPSRTYYAHQHVGTFSSDELWSTPLFQSLRELVSKGYPRERVDQIVLEAHFGLGANISMRDMAKSIVTTATRLYPSDPYAAVFQKHFVHHEILAVPHAELQLHRVALRAPETNNVLNPGRTVELFVTVRNTGTLAATGIKASATSTNPRAALSASDPAFADIVEGAVGTNMIPILLTLAADAPCGEVVDVALDLTFDGGTSTTTRLEFEIPTGVANVAGQTLTLSPALEIPDNDSAGVTSSIMIQSADVITDKAVVTVPLEVLHNYVPDLRITLTSPSGKEIILQNRGSDVSRHNLVGVYPTTLTPVDNFSKLIGEPLNGEWKLKAADLASYDKGVIKSWGINVVLGHQCTNP